MGFFCPGTSISDRTAAPHIETGGYTPTSSYGHGGKHVHRHEHPHGSQHTYWGPYRHEHPRRNQYRYTDDQERADEYRDARSRGPGNKDSSPSF